MSYLVEIAGVAAKAVRGAQEIARLSGHRVPMLDELHQTLSPARRMMMWERANAFAEGSAATQSPESTDGTDLSEPDVGTGSDVSEVEGDGFIATAIEWISDLF